MPTLGSSHIPFPTTSALCHPPNLLLTFHKVQNISIHAFRLRHQKERHDSAHYTASEEDPERVRDTDLLSAKIVEKDTGENGTELACGG